MEIIRWCVLLASMYVTYGFSLLVLNGIMWVLDRASSKVIDRDEPPQSVGYLITGVMGLRTYIAFVISAAVLAFVSLLLFPLSLDEKTKLEVAKGATDQCRCKRQCTSSIVEMSLAVQGHAWLHCHLCSLLPFCWPKNFWFKELLSCFTIILLQDAFKTTIFS